VSYCGTKHKLTAQLMNSPRRGLLLDIQRLILNAECTIFRFQGTVCVCVCVRARVCVEGGEREKSVLLYEQ
jgi:hypothetical protein